MHTPVFRLPLRFFCWHMVRFLQKKYKTLTEYSLQGHSSNMVLSKLVLIQSVLYFFKQQFSAWGYFHPDCSWTTEDEKYFKALFPVKNHLENDIVVWHNPEAVTYYHNEIFRLTKGRTPFYAKEIPRQLKKWGVWN